MASTLSSAPPTSCESDDEAFHSAPEILTSSSIDIDPLPHVLPTKYSRIEPIPSHGTIPEGEISIFKLAKEVLSNVKIGADVTNINLPASILDPESTLEKAKKSMQRGELLQDICASTDPQTRFLNVIRFNLSGLAKERFGKKPYNPVLGEVFRCCFAHLGAGGETFLLAEQVSHHPPITALHLRNETLGFYMNSYTAPEPRFWGNSLVVKLLGEIRIVLPRFGDEQYVITRPEIQMTGFITGRQRLGFGGSSVFKCEKTGLGAEIEYRGKSTFALRTDLNGISGRVYNLQTEETIYTLEGNWDKKVTITHVASKQQRVLFDYEAVLSEKSMMPICPPYEEEETWFSSRVWSQCSTAIRAGDSAAANVEKRRVEEHQRKLRKEREAKGVAWKYRYFVRSEDGNGYDIREDLKSQQLVRLSLSQDEIAVIRSGKLVKSLHQDPALDATSPDGKGTLIGRRKLLRGRHKS